MKETKNSEGIVQSIRDAMASGDIELMVNLFADDGQWILIPTNETYAGHDKIRGILAGSMKMDFHFIDSFSNAEGTKLCIEYLHNMVVTDKWAPSLSFQKPVPGTKFKLKVVWICEIIEGKIIKMNEYFDMLTLINGGTRPNPF